MTQKVVHQTPARTAKPLLGASLLAVICLLGPMGVLLPGPAFCQEGPIEERFNDLSHWEPLFFKDIDRHSRYTIVQLDGNSVLRASSNSSASAIVHQREFDVYRFPALAWRWKVENLYATADARTKSGDDYPIRIYVLFPFQAEEASAWQKLTYKLARSWYGRYPPWACLNYVWASQEYDSRMMVNAYTDRAKMFLLRMGRDHLGRWVREQRNIVKDYRMAFGEDPPKTARLAIMNDSDNTGEQSVSFIDDIRLLQEQDEEF